jgi:RNase P subunit RPR2
MRNWKLCSWCGTELTAENTNPSTLRRGDGICRKCGKNKWREYKKANPEKVLASSRAYKTSPLGRLNRLKDALLKDKTPKTDLLWSKNFYLAIIKDLICHYCSQPIYGGGHVLDRIDNSDGHRCYNVVPCCWFCNQIKSNRLSYKEMLMLSDSLKKIFHARLVTSLSAAGETADASASRADA